MTLYGYDAAYQPDLAAVKAAGGIAVNGYLTGNYATTTSSPAHALAAGLGWWATYEEGPSELVGATRATGQAVGRKILAAYTALRDDHGNPLPLDGSAAVYPSVDTSVAAADACDEAWRGLRDVLGGKLSIRYYGEGLVGDHLYQAGLIDGPFWLAAPSSWPGFDPSDPRVCIVQEVGTNVPSTDRNHLITQPSALGAIWPAGSTYGDTMPTADEIAAAVWNHGLTSPTDKKQHRAGDYVVGTRVVLGQVAAAIGTLPDRLAAKAGSGTLNADQIKAEAEAAIRDVLGSLDTPAAAQ